MSVGKAMLRMVLSSETTRSETHNTASTAHRRLVPTDRVPSVVATTDPTLLA
jgi:hypothetical protein